MKKEYYKYILILVLFLLIILFNNKNIKLKNNINAKSICEQTIIYSNENQLTLKHCFDKKIQIMKKNKILSTLDIKNVNKFYSFYCMEDNITYMYIIDKYNKVYTINSKDIFNEKYSVKKIESLNNVYEIKKLSIINKDNIYEEAIYAIKNNGKLKYIKRI